MDHQICPITRMPPSRYSSTWATSLLNYRMGLSASPVRHRQLQWFSPLTTGNIETVDNLGDWIVHSSLALDNAGYPHISYDDQGTDDIKYAWYNGVNWHIEIVDREWSVNSHSLVLDGFGQPHISYSDYAYGDLKYARKWPFSIDKQVTPSDSLSDIDALTHTLTYSVTLSGPSWNYYLLDPLPDTVDYLPDSITIDI